MPEDTAATYWATPLPADTNWRDNDRIVAFVQAVAPRDTPVDQAAEAIRKFRAATPAQDRDQTMALAFIGVVDATNEERSGVISRIKALNERQSKIAAMATKASSEVEAIPQDATGADADKRQDAETHRDFLTRTFNDVRKTMRYACEIPSEIDARLGQIAKLMQANG